MRFLKKTVIENLPAAADALPGRDRPLPLTNKHVVLGTPLQPPYPQGSETLIVGMGCFWGAEKRFWSLPGVITTAVGYSGGFTPNPSYEEVCSGMTAHNEVVLIVFDPKTLALTTLLSLFWQAHNPTQGMRQGNDCGTQYRSGIYYSNDTQRQQAVASQAAYQRAMVQALGRSAPVITTEIQAATAWYFAEDYHQQYLAKNPGGYCGLGGLGIDFPCN
ncbi:MAG: peptide-methionine (S)-S-oxide reductase MsrA [Cellvibrionaceae bacterium]|nr:peptide-methionine (S)-S-oxide reductase MsrA [Cellvibrionaceae bacterium]